MIIHDHAPTSSPIRKKIDWTVLHQAITLSSMLAKCQIKLNWKISGFQTSNLQFGFKEDSSTVICCNTVEY